MNLRETMAHVYVCRVLSDPACRRPGRLSHSSDANWNRTCNCFPRPTWKRFIIHDGLWTVEISESLDSRSPLAQLSAWWARRRILQPWEFISWLLVDCGEQGLNAPSFNGMLISKAIGTYPGQAVDRWSWARKKTRSDPRRHWLQGSRCYHSRRQFNLSWADVHKVSHRLT